MHDLRLIISVLANFGAVGISFGISALFLNPGNTSRSSYLFWTGLALMNLFLYFFGYLVSLNYTAKLGLVPFSLQSCIKTEKKREQ